MLYAWTFRAGRMGLISGTAVWQRPKLRALSNSHTSKHSASLAVEALRRQITEEDVDTSINQILTGSLQSLRDAYENATASNQPGNLFKEVLLACALARADDAGYFVPAAVRDPLEKILARSMTIAQYQNHLNDWHTPKRGEILQRIGDPRSYRFRFAEPTMQPYVLMKGI
jgi:hypothetical protein